MKTGYMYAFKNWYALCRPSKKYFALQIISTLLTAILYVIEPICSAQVLTYLVEGMYQSAMIWLVITLGFLVVRQLIWHYNYWNWSRLLGYSYRNINAKLYDKVIGAQSKNFKETSKEKILNTIGSDVYTVCNFSDLFATKMSRLFRVVITIVIVFIESWIAALIILAVSVLNFFMYKYFDTKQAIANNASRIAKDNMFEKINDMTSGREVVNDLGLNETIKEKYLSSCDEFVKAQHNVTMHTSNKSNIVYIIWNVIVCLTTLYLIYMIQGNALTYTAYLIITSYLTSSIEKINDFYGIFENLRNAEIATARVNTIIEFKEKDLIEYGKNMKNNIHGSVSFNNVSLKERDIDNDNVGEISDISFFINEGECVLIQGQTKCGKRQIFRLLKRAVKPDSGTITIDGIDLFEFYDSIEKQNVMYCGSKPYFFEGSIMDNLSYVESNKNKIFKMMKECEIDEFIKSLPEGYDTNINKHHELIPAYERFVIGFARTLLTKSEIIMIYEFPTGLNAEQREKARFIINKFKRKRTLIIFSAVEDSGKYCDRIIKIQKGKIVE